MPLARVEKIEKTGGRYWEISAEIPAIDLKEKEKSVDVKVENPWGADILRGYFVYTWPDLHVEKERIPYKIPKEGGWVRVKGDGFGGIMEANIGSQSLEIKDVNKDSLYIYFLKGTPGTKGEVEVHRKYTTGHPDNDSAPYEYGV